MMRADPAPECPVCGRRVDCAADHDAGCEMAAWDAQDLRAYWHDRAMADAAEVRR